MIDIAAFDRDGYAITSSVRTPKGSTAVVTSELNGDLEWQLREQEGGLSGR